MRWNTYFLGAMASLAATASADPTWPASTDEIEEIMYQVTGYRNRQFGGTVIPCNNLALGPGRNGPGEWIRTAFHDVATTRAGLGGLDASLQYELQSGENVGQAFATTLGFMKDYYTRQSSMSDLIAVGLYYATRACGGPAVPVRGGHVDATTGLGPGYIPLVADPPQSLMNKFARMGFSPSEAVELTTCGHTVGKVHAANFPTVIDPSDPLLVNGAIGLDGTDTKFDNMNAVEYLANNSTEPLISNVVSRRKRTNSDHNLYNYERNTTIALVAKDTQASFNARCSRVFQKMIEIVPNGVTLTDPITPYFVKPVQLSLGLNNGGDTLQFTGFIRIRTTGPLADPVTGVSITYKDRNGGSSCGFLGCVFKLSKLGITRGFDDTFDWYPINGQIATASGISSFTVTLTKASGQTQLMDNNGNNYPVQDKAILMQSQSCFLSSGDTSGQLTVTAAIRNDRLNMAASAFVSYLQDTGDSNLPVPQLKSSDITLTKGRCAGYYTVYTGSYTIPGQYGYAARVDVKSGSGSDLANDDFNAVSVIGASCSGFSYPQQCFLTLPSASSSSSSVASSTSSSTSSVSSSTSSSVSSTSSVSSSATSTASSTASSSSASSSSASSSSASSSSASSSSASSSSASSSSASSSSASSSSASSASSVSSTASQTGSSSLSSSTLSAGSSTVSVPASITSSSATTSSSAPAATPHHREVMGGYKFVGCQTEGSNVRALAEKTFAYDGMTLESCMKNCTGFNYWGTEYGRECYCGNTLAPTSTEAALADCNMLCSGDNTQYCGAGNRLELYLTTSIPTPTATLVHKPTVSPYTRKGCYSELPNGRALPLSIIANDQMTNDVCAAHCAKYPWFATQYASECYCGDSLDPGAKLVADEQCNMPCSGNQFQYCGGPSRLEVYYSSTVATPGMPKNITSSDAAHDSSLWDLVGCYTEAANGVRALNGKIGGEGSNSTLNTCAAFCNGFDYFGAEYGDECYCGNKLNDGSKEVAASDCNMFCPGNSLQYCGAGNRLSLYKRG